MARGTLASRARYLRVYRLTQPKVGELVFAWHGQCMPMLFDCVGHDDEYCGDRESKAIPRNASCMILYVHPRPDSDGNHKLVVLTPLGTGWAWSSAFKRA